LKSIATGPRQAALALPVTSAIFALLMTPMSASAELSVHRRSPGLVGLLASARPGDSIVVHTLDRLGRNLRASTSSTKGRPTAISMTTRSCGAGGASR
jgi:hypothetical protein